MNEIESGKLSEFEDLHHLEFSIVKSQTYLTDLFVRHVRRHDILGRMVRFILRHQQYYGEFEPVCKQKIDVRGFRPRICVDVAQTSCG